MLSAVSILLPVFGLIFAGFACRRTNVLGPAAASELNRFVVWLALPALLFDILAHATWRELYQPAFVAAFGLAGLAVFAAVVGVGSHNSLVYGELVDRLSQRLVLALSRPISIGPAVRNYA